MEAELDMLPGLLPPAEASTTRGSVSSSSLLNSCPVMPKRAPSHWMESVGVWFDSSVDAWLMRVVTPSICFRLAEMVSSQLSHSFRFGRVVALHPHLDSRQHAHDFLLADFQGAAEGMVRRAVGPRRLEQVSFAKQEARRLRAADALAAAVGNGRGAALEVNVGDGEDLGRRVHDDGHVVALGGFRDDPGSERAVVLRPTQDVGHSGALVKRGFKLGSVADGDDLHAQHADSVVVDVARIGRDHHLALQPFEVGQTLHALGIGARNARCRAVRQRGAATGCHDAPLGPGQLG